MSHYRSLNKTGGSLSCDIDPRICKIGTQTLLRPDGTNNFWIGAGGAQPLDIGVSVPLFSGDITMRGASCEMTFSTLEATSGGTVKVKAWLVWTTPDPDFANMPTSAAIGWDPTMVADFAKDIGKVYRFNEFELGDGSSTTLKYHIKTMKIDQKKFDALGSIPIVIYTYEQNQNTGDPFVFFFKQSCNLTFSADAIGTT